MKQLKVAIQLDHVSEALIANFNASAKLMQFFTVETSPRVTRHPRSSFERVVLNDNDLCRGSSFSAFARLMGQIRPEVIVTMGWCKTEHLQCLYWGLSNNVPVVLASDSARRDFPRNKLKEAVKRKVVSLFAVGWAASSAAAEYLMELGMARERILIGPVDSIDIQHFKNESEKAQKCAVELRAKLNLPRQYFVSVGRIAPEKNLSTMLKAYKLYKDKFGSDAWKLVIVGSGPLDRDIRQTIRDLNLESDVHLPGHVDYKALPAYYALAGAFVHASTKDTWAVVVNEAMATGLPVIVSSQCGSAEELIVEGENGFVFNARDPNELARRLGQIAHGDLDTMRMGKANQGKIAKWAPHGYAASLFQAARLARSMPLPKLTMMDTAILSVILNILPASRTA